MGGTFPGSLEFQTLYLAFPLECRDLLIKGGSVGARDGLGSERGSVLHLSVSESEWEMRFVAT